ncbi:hypothetical protein EC957_011044, partial [Mortierella hygrophila]
VELRTPRTRLSNTMEEERSPSGTTPWSTSASSSAAAVTAARTAAQETSLSRTSGPTRLMLTSLVSTPTTVMSLPSLDRAEPVSRKSARNSRELSRTAKRNRPRSAPPPTAVALKPSLSPPV